MSKLSDFFISEAALRIATDGVTAVRTGFRTVLSDEAKEVTLARHLSGQLPYYYRKLESVVDDFQSRHDALDIMIDLMGTAPQSPKFRNSHCGEILAGHYVEEKLGLRRLYSKLTMTTSEDTNAHKMDGLFVDLSSDPFDYVFVEAKASTLPTETTATKTHRAGLLKNMIASLDSYVTEEPRMEFIRIRENLQGDFEPSDREQILSDFRGIGPDLKYLGASVTNAVTINDADDDFILSEASACDFDYYAIVVTDLKKLAEESFGFWDEIGAAVKKCSR